MQRSTQRILTTHTGSLPRAEDLRTLLKARDAGTLADVAGFERRVTAAVDHTVREQRRVGVDIVNDGEQSKPDYSTYIKNRFTGFAGAPTKPYVTRGQRDFPEFFANNQAVGASSSTQPTCVAPIEWKDFAAVERDIADLKAATAGLPGSDVFMTSVSPGQAARFLGNVYYPSHEAYLRALGAALKREYDAIAAAGFILQIDCPDLGSGWNNQFSDLSLTEFHRIVELHLAVLDEATRDVPPEQFRLHLCWGNYEGPHHHDIPFAEIVGPVLRSRAGAISFEGANPRHEHEWKLWKKVKLPAGKILIPGVLDSTSNFIEHPELIADRICRYAEAVGRENVIAGVDCGFATFAGRVVVHPTIVWAKLAALSEGAKLASTTLWGKSSAGE
jgi:5-methyltetrahydropteroyltriglutamate--homocysteine methyltransferase